MATVGDFVWGDDQIAALRVAITDDGMSCGQAAAKLSATFRHALSRSAVIGKCNRLGIRLSNNRSASAPRLASPRPPARPRPIAAAPAPKPARPLKSPPLTAERQATVNAAVDALRERLGDGMAGPQPGTAVALVALAAHACRWPIGDPREAGFRYCGEPAVRVYCDDHALAGIKPTAGANADKIAAMIHKADSRGAVYRY